MLRLAQLCRKESHGRTWNGFAGCQRLKGRRNFSGLKRLLGFLLFPLLAAPFIHRVTVSVLGFSVQGFGWWWWIVITAVLGLALF